MTYQFQLMITGVILSLNLSTISSQEAWLSNAESINQFREQVELIKPDSSRYEFASYDRAINLNGRQI